jgi:hypothetical protein
VQARPVHPEPQAGQGDWSLACRPRRPAPCPSTGALVIIAQKAQTRTDQANEEAAAKHREELGQYQTALLERNTELTQQIHALAEQMTALTQQVHAATCGTAE